MKKGPNNTTINELICEKMALLKSNGKYGTLHNYRGLLHFIERHFGVLMAKDCNAAAVMRMKSLMSQYTTSTQASYFACLRSIWNYANYIGATGKTDYPFQRHSYEIDKVKVPRIQRRTESYLSVEDMSKLYWHWFTIPNDKKRDVSRKKCLGLFLLSYLGNGANVNDLVRLTYNADWYNSKGQILSFVRHKTQDKSPVKVRIPMTEHLRPIFEFLASEEERNAEVFGCFLNGVALDDEEKLLKRVMYWNTYASKRVRYECKLIGIRDDVSMTFARHSFISNANHLGFNFSIIENMAGHSLSGVSGHYIGQTPIEKLFEIGNALILDNIA